VSSTLTSHSIFPTASFLVWAWASKRSQVPSRLQRLKRSKQVCQGPYLSGRSRQGEPVRSFQRMPLTTVRCSLHCPRFNRTRARAARSLARLDR
jgi:hypothetical protein